MMVDSTNANNLEQNKPLYIGSRLNTREERLGQEKTRERTKPGNANKSINPAMMNELHMNLPLLLPLNQVQIYELNLKIPKCLRMDVERGELTQMSCLPNESHHNKL